MAHASKFIDGLKGDQRHVNHILDEMELVNVLEDKMRREEIGWEQRTKERKEHASPILERLGKWLKENQYSYRSESPMGKAITHAYKRCSGLSAYVLHGQIEIDNDFVEMQLGILLLAAKPFYLRDRIKYQK
ncbi:Transposase IS66 family protein [Cyclobacterium lianum]|uniref:Transposase IS66 family protein n=1 Tax=Cyclobacterium lianum TaxID=388280 RepID=A0A1M7PQ03_9BACT|nr:transposase [Cyclobacterium lianum]SHN19371.1 Transposase IS66 family protein [Cyclobacterium lianum]